MNNDGLLRTAAVCAAVALVAAPYWRQIKDAAVRVAEAAKGHATTAGRIAAACLIIAAAWGKIPLPKIPTGVVTVPVEVEKPSEAMLAKVQPIADAMRDAPMGDRLLWANLWVKAAIVVAGDTAGAEQVLTDTRALRMFNILALDIGWRRIGQHKPGQYAGLRAAVERAMVDTLGLEQKPMDAEKRAAAVELYKAIAWAGMNRE